MQSKILDKESVVYYWIFILLSIAAIVTAWASEIYVLFVVPIAIIIGVITFIDFKKIFYFLLFHLLFYLYFY